MRLHLLGIEGLTRQDFETLLGNARAMVEISERDIKKVPTLRGRTIINLFLEPSTRTRTSFELAGKRLSADVLNISESGSSVKKGETLLDTARTLEAMAPDILVVRHGASGAPHLLAKYLKNTSVVNAGDGTHEHPTQALLDCLSLTRHFKEIPRGKTIAIVGDVRHSRVARSAIFAHHLLGNSIRLVGPPTFVPKEFADPRAFGGKVTVHHDLGSGLSGVDVVMCLRIQMERMASHFIPTLDEYASGFGISESILRRYAPDCVVLHPGPMNRGVEITSEVADGPRSLIGLQVNSGVAARMAVLVSLASVRSTVEV
jgi:aspartate carbamoyltransferase catalytic subunit